MDAYTGGDMGQHTPPPAGRGNHPDFPTLDQLGPHLDQAFATGQIVHAVEYGLAVVPDVVMFEAEANGHDTPVTTTVERADGRTAYLYQVDPRRLGR
jgi:hypothetical protein